MVDSGAAITAGPVEAVTGREPGPVVERGEHRRGPARREHDLALAHAGGGWAGVGQRVGAAGRELLDDADDVDPQVVDLRGQVERDPVRLREPRPEARRRARRRRRRSTGGSGTGNVRWYAWPR